MVTTHQYPKAPGKPDKRERRWTPTGGQALAVGEPGRPGADDDLVLLLTSRSKLVAAGLNMNHMRVVKVSNQPGIVGIGSAPSVPLDALRRVRFGHIVLTGAHSAEVLRGESAQFSEVLSALRGLEPDQIAEVAKQIETEAPSAVATPNELYQVLTAQQMADRMSLTLPVVYQRETAGEIFAVLEPYRKSGRQFPAFQLHHKLNRPLLLKVIQAYRDADVNTTLLWSFLRTPQRIFDGLTPIEMLVGGMVPAYEGLTPVERAEAILDVVNEELSRVRLQ